ncbi:hypothetical protein RchiOBHm_Chr6g0261941 [Rosa chinensis]|uniref:Uncharacterized protein n=1 Tax=Rosa chinensis TaxID=74649 RepID=A0A2P6PNI5_ROSCH|nr:hypothetical protein RchiOBHm_Chr6g0261941 [Rosa chinensis]
MYCSPAPVPSRQATTVRFRRIFRCCLIPRSVAGQDQRGRSGEHFRCCTLSLLWMQEF